MTVSPFSFVLLAALVAAFLMSVVFVFHWKQYGCGAKAVYVAALVYFGILAFLILHIFSSYQALT